MSLFGVHLLAAVGAGEIERHVAIVRRQTRFGLEARRTEPRQKAPRQKSAVGAIRTPAPEKYQGLRTSGRYAALVFMGAWLGPRWNEAMGLRICDLDMLRREVTFGRMVVNRNESTTFVERGSKTEDWRTVPVPAPVMDMLAAHIGNYVDKPTDRLTFLFTTRNGTHPLRSNFTRELRTALPRAGLAGRRVTWLTLRERFEEGRLRLEAYMQEKRGGRTQPLPKAVIMYYDNPRVQIHPAARRHGVREDDLRNAAARPLVVADIDPDADPPKLFVIGPDTANLLELVMLILVDDRLLAIHAMPLRRAYYGLLPNDDGGLRVD